MHPSTNGRGGGGWPPGPPSMRGARSQNGKTGAAPSQNGSSPPNGEPEEQQPPKSWVDRWQELRKQWRATLAAFPRAFSLVWQSHKGFTLSTAFISILFGIIPAVTAWVGKLLIDGVVAAIKQSGQGNTVTYVIQLVIF